MRNFKLPLNCISHSLILSIAVESKSLKSSYSSRTASSPTENVANPREASRPANAAYGPPTEFNPMHYFKTYM